MVLYRPLTMALLSSVFWLGRGTNQLDATPDGSGTLVNVDGADYLVTAFHVWKQQNNPLVRCGGEWLRSNAEIVAYDEELDIAILRPKPNTLRRYAIDLLFHEEGQLIFGIPGVALGFPDVLDSAGKSRVMDHIVEMDDWPTPIPAQTLYYSGENERIMICSGYVNSGYSGGLLAFPDPWAEKWVVRGIITSFPRLWRPLSLPEGSLLADGNPKSQEHTGLVAAVTIKEVAAMVREGRLSSLE